MNRFKIKLIQKNYIDFWLNFQKEIAKKNTSNFISGSFVDLEILFNFI